MHNPALPFSGFRPAATVWIKRIVIALAVLLLLAVAAAVRLICQLRPEPLQGRGGRVDEDEPQPHAGDQQATIELSVFPRVAVKLNS